MKNKNFCIPNGIEYYMPKEALEFEKLKVKALKVFKKYKYNYVSPPIFDNLDNLLNLKSSDIDNKTVTFLDKLSGSEIGIRADITPQIAKIDFQITHGKSNARFAYMGDILRLSSNLFDRKNPYQIGAENFGNVSKSTDIEIIKLMLEVISLSGEKRIIIELGNLSIINNILATLALNDENKNTLIDLINLKSISEIKSFFTFHNLSRTKLSLIIDLISTSGDLMVLKEIKNILKKYKMNVDSNLNELNYIAQKISKYKKFVDVQIDLCELHSFNYQSDIIYTAYVSNFRKEIARGGRYIAYKTAKNISRYATGFSLDLKDILYMLRMKGK